MRQNPNRVGRYVVTSTLGEKVNAYVPQPLPPNPPLAIEQFYSLLDTANQAIGRLDGLQALLPDVSILLYFYNRREAVLSSQIEGTQSSLSELLLFENDLLQGKSDAEEVSNYVAAMEHGLQRIRDGFPLSNRLFREMHSVLMRSGRGSDKTPGDFRTSQNWIGGSRPGNAVYVPPPVTEMQETMSDLEKFLHREGRQLPLLVDAALAHVQFESAHPFLDGNGRIGRLLITLLLCERKVLQTPSLYLSLYFKEHRDEYYGLLQDVRLNGDWEAWVKFFLHGVRTTAERACDTAFAIRDLFEHDRTKIRGIPRNGSMIQVHEFFERRPIATLQQICERTRLTLATVAKATEKLRALGVAKEFTGRRRDRIFVYEKYLDLLNEGTGPSITDPNSSTKSSSQTPKK
ncbi:MAG TPA: Fic family protein [Silvibacterium sp.]|nr:Fic family protein [Silvibacterium sp.]